MIGRVQMHRIVRLASISCITGFSGAVMPGPMLVLVIGQTFARGFAAVLAICAGHALLELVTVLLLAAGLRITLEKPVVRASIGWIGGAALIYFGVSMLRSASGISLDLKAMTDGGLTWTQLMIAGASVCLANPYFLGWWATVGTGQMAHSAPLTFGEYLAFYVGHELSDLAWFGFVGLLVVSGKGYLSPAFYHGLIRVCGAIIIILGAWFVVSTLTSRLSQKPGGPLAEME